MTKLDGSTSAAAQPQPVWFTYVAAFSSVLNIIAASIAAVLLVLMISLILVEIVLRFFSMSTFMTDVLVGHGVAAVTFLSMAWALEQGSMIRISAITQRLPDKLRLAAEMFSIVVSGALVVWLMGFEWRSIVKLWTRGSTSEHYLPIPLWIPEMFFFAGLALLALQLLVLGLRLFVVGQASDASLKL